MTEPTALPQSAKDFGFRFSDAVLIAFVTGFAYLLAYAFELGRMTYYRLPVMFIDVSLVAVLKAIVACYFGAFLMLPALWEFWKMAIGSGPLKRRIGWVLLFLGPSLFFFTIVPPEVKIFLWALVGIVALYQFCLPMLSDRSHEKYLSKLIKYDATAVIRRTDNQQKARENFYQVMDRLIGFPVALVIFWMYLFSASAYRLGYSEGQNATDYLVGRYADGTEIAFIQRTADSVLVGLELSREHRYTGRIRIIDIKSEKEPPKFSMAHLGPIEVIPGWE